MMLLRDLVVHLMPFDAESMVLVMFVATAILLMAQCSKKKNKKKKAGNTKSEPAQEAQPPTPPAEEKEKKPAPAVEGDKKKKGAGKKEKAKGTKSKTEEQPAKEVVTAQTVTTTPSMPTAIPAPAPTTAADPMKTFTEQTMLQLQNIQLPPGMIPVLLPPAVPGGTPTVIMMPAKGAMQSMAAVQSKQTAVASAVKAQSTSKTSQKEPSLYEAIEISKDDGDKGGGKESVKGSVKGSVKESAKESSKKSEKDSEGSKKSKKEVDLTKTGMADQGSYQTLADIDTKGIFDKK